MLDPDEEEFRADAENDEDDSDRESEGMLSFGTAMLAYAAIGALCLFTLKNTALFLALIIVGALALKTWLARVKSRLEKR